MAGRLPIKAARQQISSAITALIQIGRLADGKRKVMSIQEITGMEEDHHHAGDIRLSPDWRRAGTVLGHFSATGVRPKFVDRLRAHGVMVPDALFDPNRHA